MRGPGQPHGLPISGGRQGGGDVWRLLPPGGQHQAAPHVDPAGQKAGRGLVTPPTGTYCHSHAGDKTFFSISTNSPVQTCGLALWMQFPSGGTAGSEGAVGGNGREKTTRVGVVPEGVRLVRAALSPTDTPSC